MAAAGIEPVGVSGEPRPCRWMGRDRIVPGLMYAQLAVDIKDRGSDSIFVREGRGLFALNPNVAQELPLVERPGSPEKERNSDAGDRLSFTDAAERVLMESSDREPLHYGAITERALERGLIRTEGRTPAATMYSSVLTEMRRSREHLSVGRIPTWRCRTDC